MADPDLGWTDLGVRPDASGFGRDLDRQLGPQMSTVGRSAASRFSAGFRRAATVGAAGAGLLALKVGKDSIGQASDLNESLNAVNVTYGRQAKAVQELGRQAAESLGLSNTEFNGLSVRFSAFAEQVAGGSGPRVVSTLDDLTTRAADFASVMNLEVAEAANLFQSGLAGETEPLRRYGLDLSAAAVQAHAYKEGIAAAGAELTEGEKVQARYSLLMQQTAKTQGDFANTSDSLANQQRILNARWDDAQAQLGTALLPVLEDVTKFLVDDGVPAFEKASRFIVNDFAPAVGDLASDLKPVAAAAGDLVGFLNDLPSEAKLAGVIALVGGLGAAKLRGGSGLTGSIGSAIGVMKPVPVLVTNPGFGAGGGGVAGTTSKAGLARSIARLVPPALVADVGYETFLGDFFGLRDQSNFDKQKNDPEGFARLGAPRVLDGPDFKSDFGGMVKEAVTSAAEITEAFSKLPKGLRTEIGLTGVDASKRAVRDLIANYDLTPREKRTTFEVFGYDLVLDRAKRIEAAYDRAARDRVMRVSVEYEQMGFETRGGLQRGGGTTTTQTGRSRAGGGLG